MGTLLGIGQGDTVVIPPVCYPTYEVGARLAGATVVRSDSLTALGPAPVRLVWLNSPGNPTGRVLPEAHLRKVVAWARERDAVVVNDECYLTLGWEATPVSILSVCGGSYDRVLAGDPGLVEELLGVRKHAGMMVPTPVQAAMVAALANESEVDGQRSRYRARRALLRPALEKAGFTVEHSEAGLYLWATRGEECWSTVDWFAARGIVVCPGTFYGPTGARHVRLALTATDDRVESAAGRLAG